MLISPWLFSMILVRTSFRCHTVGGQTIEGAAPLTSRVSGVSGLTLPACVDAPSRLAPSQLPSIMPLLRLLTMRLSTVFMTWCSVGVNCTSAPLGQARLSEEKFDLKAPLLRHAQMKEILRGQMLAGGLWSDFAIEILWTSPRHSGTKASIAPFQWLILQSARLNMILSNGSMFDLSPGESSGYFDNYFSCCT